MPVRAMVLKRFKPFTQEWVDSLAHVPEAGMVGAILVTDPRGLDKVYDPDTDTWDYPTAPTVYEGKARVQPIRSDVQRVRPGDSTNVLAIRFSVPVASVGTDIRPGMLVEVTSAPLNPSLLEYVFYVSEGVDSTNPIEKTFHAVTDLEATWDSNG